MKVFSAAIVGGAGYAGGEAIRLLLNHPDIELRWVHSNSNAGNRLSDVHTDLLGDTDMRFTDRLLWDGLDAVLLCLGHGDARKFLTENKVPDSVRIVDLSQDFRLAGVAAGGPGRIDDRSEGRDCLQAMPRKEEEDRRSNARSPQPVAAGTADNAIDGRTFVYGLPEMNLDAIVAARNIANPGCFATCLQLGLLPLAAAGALRGEINITAATGSTGAGQKLAPTSHFSWRANNMSVYKAFEHQHLLEITESLRGLMPGFDAQISFIPMRGDFARGIIASTVVDCDLSQEAVSALYKDYYRDAAFTFVSDRSIDLKQVVNTNKCFINLQKHGGKLLIVSIIDNLLKGASGQAVQNLNVMLGLDQHAGLRLKSIVF